MPTIAPRRTAMRCAIYAVIVPLVLLLGACSMARLGYSNGDTLVYWWLNGYVDLDSEQSPWVKQRIDKLFLWHRHTQLKTYIPLLVSAQHRLEHNVTKAEVMADYADLTKALDRVIDEASPDLADLAIAMNADNVAALKKKFETNDKKFRKDYLDGNQEQRQEHRYKLVMEWAEYWFGDFSDEQEATIRRASDARPLNNEMWMTDRLERQQTELALINRIHQEKLSHEAATEAVKEYINNNYLVRTNATPEMKAFFEASKDGVAQMAVLIINISTPKQRTHAREKLQQWIDDFNVLQAKG